MFAYQIAAWSSIKERVQEIDGQLSSCLKLLLAFRDDEGTRLDEHGSVEGQAYNIVEAITHAQRALRALADLKPDRKRPFPTGMWVSARAAVDQMAAAANDLQARVQGFPNSGVVLVTLNGSVLGRADNRNPVVSFTDPVTSMVNHADALFPIVSSLAALKVPVRQAPDPSDEQISDDAKSVLDSLVEAERGSAEAARAAESARAILDDLTHYRDEVTNSIADLQIQIAGFAGTAEQRAATIAEIDKAASNDAAVIRSKLDDIDKLQGNLESTGQIVNRFASTLKKTEGALSSNRATLDQLIAEALVHGDTVTRLSDDARDMLSSATVAGLAKAFADERDALDASLSGAFWQFVFGILLLSSVTFALASYVLNIPMSIFGVAISGIHPELGNKYEPTMAGILSRIVIITGPFWFTLFASRRYKHLFDLRQQYSHKYNMAFSMEGFKKQSPSNAEGIAAWVFTIVAQSPYDQKPSRPMDESPLVALKELGVDLADKALKRLGGKPGE